MRISDWSSDVCSSDLDRLAELRTGLGAADPAVAIPMRAAAFDADAVNHAGAREPVVARGIGGESRVGTVAQIAAGKRRGDFAVDRQRLQRQFLLHRLVDAG